MTPMFPRKTKDNVRNSSFVTELLHMPLGTAQVVPWETREQMMHDLELETTVDNEIGLVEWHKVRSKYSTTM